MGHSDIKNGSQTEHIIVLHTQVVMTLMQHKGISPDQIDSQGYSFLLLYFREKSSVQIPSGGNASKFAYLFVLPSIFSSDVASRLLKLHLKKKAGQSPTLMTGKTTVPTTVPGKYYYH